MEDGFDKKLHELWVAENGRATKIAAYAKRHDAFQDLRRRVDGGDLRTFAIRNPVGAWQYFRAELTRPATLRRERPAPQAAHASATVPRVEDDDPETRLPPVLRSS